MKKLVVLLSLALSLLLMSCDSRTPVQRAKEDFSNCRYRQHYSDKTAALCQKYLKVQEKWGSDLKGFEVKVINDLTEMFGKGISENQFKKVFKGVAYSDSLDKVKNELRESFDSGLISEFKYDSLAINLAFVEMEQIEVFDGTAYKFFDFKNGECIVYIVSFTKDHELIHIGNIIYFHG